MKEKFFTKERTIFLLIAFGITYIMGIPLYFAKQKGIDINIFPNFQMHLPAAGVMIAMLLTRKSDPNLPKKFYYTYLLGVLILFALTIISFFIPGNQWLSYSSLVMVAFSVVLWIMLINQKKNNRAYALDKGSIKRVLLAALIFVVLYFARIFIYAGITGEWNEINALLQTRNLGLAAMLIPNFLLTMMPFFGEEYGWRTYLQPIFQKDFGMWKGIFLLGLVWGLWHLPLNLFYYSADGMGAMSLMNQIGNCITLSFFLGFVFNYSKSTWSAALIHFLNNNMVLFFVEDVSSSVLQNNIYSIQSILLLFGLSAVLFGPFMFTKWMKKDEYRMKTIEERAEEERLNPEDIEEDESPGRVSEYRKSDSGKQVSK